MQAKGVGQLNGCAENLIEKNTLSVGIGQLSEEWRKVIIQIIQTNIFYQLFALRIKKILYTVLLGFVDFILPSFKQCGPGIFSHLCDCLSASSNFFLFCCEDKI